MIYVICVCLHTVVSNTYYVVVLFCLSSPCVLCCLHLGSCYLQLFVGGLVCDLCFLSLFTYGGVQHILCCGFVLFVFTLCLVLSSPCVLCCLHLVSCYLQLFVGGLMCDLCYLSLFTYGGVQHILCCGFVLFVFTLCLVLSSPCVLLPPVVCRRGHV